MKEVADSLADGVGEGLASGMEQANGMQHLAQLAVGEGGFLRLDPLRGGVLAGEGIMGHRPEPLHGVPPVQNFDAHGKTHEDNGPGHPLGPRPHRR